MADRGRAPSPGLVNAHTHIYSGLAPLGMPAPAPAPENFLQILERVWWRLDRALDEATLRASARLYVAEALLAGTTALVDHHESPGFIEGSLDVIADACQELGMRAVLCYGATERNGGRAEAEAGLAECRRFVRENRRPLVRGVVGVHASFTVSDDTLAAAGELCRELRVPLHVHVAEDAADVDDARRRGYAGPIERLASLGALPAGSILAHGVHLSADQVRDAAARGCWFVQNPRSNHGNDVGYPLALRGCPRVALGTDGYPADMVAELDALRAFAAAYGDDPDAASLRLTRSRSLVERDDDPLPSPPSANAVRVWADHARRAAVEHLVADGRTVVERGELRTGDIHEIREVAAGQAERLWARLASIPVPAPPP